MLIDVHQLLFSRGEPEPSYRMKGDNHVGFMIAVDIDETQGDRDQVGVRAVELGADVDTSVACVTARQFDDFDPSMKIDGQKMARHAWGLVMPDVGIDLEGAWPAIPQVIQGGGEPGGHNAEHRDQSQGG